MLSFVERCQSVLAGVILALLIASVVLVPQNRALADEGGGGSLGEGSVICILFCGGTCSTPQPCSGTCTGFTCPSWCRCRPVMLGCLCS